MSLHQFVVAKHVPETYTSEILFFALMNRMTPIERHEYLADHPLAAEWALRNLSEDGWIEGDL